MSTTGVDTGGATIVASFDDESVVAAVAVTLRVESERLGERVRSRVVEPDDEARASLTARPGDNERVHVDDALPDDSVRLGESVRWCDVVIDDDDDDDARASPTARPGDNERSRAEDVVVVIVVVDDVDADASRGARLGDNERSCDVDSVADDVDRAKARNRCASSNSERTGDAEDAADDDDDDEDDDDDDGSVALLLFGATVLARARAAGRSRCCDASSSAAVVEAGASLTV